VVKHDRLHDREVEALVVAHSDVLEADHLLHALGEVGRASIRADEEIEGLPALLRNTEGVDPDEAHRAVDRALFARFGAPCRGLVDSSSCARHQGLIG
jgi:hypothetical protein